MTDKEKIRAEVLHRFDNYSVSSTVGTELYQIIRFIDSLPEEKGKDIKEDHNIEWKYEDVFYGKRRFYYRILPSELSWFRRFFKNPWRAVYRTIRLNTTDIYDVRDYNTHIKSLKTLNDVLSYQKNEEELLYKNRKEAIENGEIWPDEK